MLREELILKVEKLLLLILAGTSEGLLLSVSILGGPERRKYEWENIPSPMITFETVNVFTPGFHFPPCDSIASNLNDLYYKLINSSSMVSSPHCVHW